MLFPVVGKLQILKIGRESSVCHTESLLRTGSYRITFNMASRQKRLTEFTPCVHAELVVHT
jgi:hypothetical protein